VLTFNDFEEYEEPIAIDEATRTKFTSASAKCLECEEVMHFDDDAVETITFARMCENRQSVFQCPVCRCRHVIFAEGEVAITSTSDCVTVSAPEGGYCLVKASNQQGCSRPTIAGKAHP